MGSPTVLEPGHLTIGVDASPPPPMQFGDLRSGAFTGLEVDLLEAVGKRLDLVPRYRSALWSTILAELNEGALDVVCTAATVSAERSEKLVFGTPYLRLQLVAVVADAGDRLTPEDLTSQALAVRAGTIAEKYIRTHFSPSSLLRTEYNAEAYEAVRSGRVQGLVDDSPIAAWFVAHWPGLRVAGALPGTTSHYAMVFARHNAGLARATDAIVHDLRANGTLRRLRRRWLEPGSARRLARQ